MKENFAATSDGASSLPQEFVVFFIKTLPPRHHKLGKEENETGGEKGSEPALTLSPNPLSFHTRTRPDLKFHSVLIYQVFVGLLLLNLAILIKNLK